jgi:acyl-coenzyme A thioesterase PaaI-like protein
MRKIRRIKEHGKCYVCGSANPHGIGLSWFTDEKNTIFSTFRLGVSQQGPPGYAHRGASAAILDEAMGASIWRTGINVAVVNLEINYLLPLPLEKNLSLKARFIRRYAKKFLASGEIKLDDGSIAVSGTGIYVEAPQLFEAVRYSLEIQ